MASRDLAGASDRERRERVRRPAAPGGGRPRAGAGRAGRGQLLVALLGTAALLATAGQPAGAGDADAVLRIKAAFVLNFLKFAEWPAGAAGADGADLVLAVVGDDPIAPVIRAELDGKTARGRTVRVRSFPDPVAWQKDAAASHALFLTPAAAPLWPSVRTAVSGRPVLTIADQPGFCAAGGMLNLRQEGDRLRFEANPAAALGVGLRMQADLLSLAVVVATKVEGQVPP